MAFESLSDRLQGAVEKMGKKGKISEADLKEMMREVRLALLEADVNFKVVKDFVRRVNDRALNAEVLASLSPAQQVIKIVNEELTDLMGGDQVGIAYNDQGPTVIMMVGLQGAGKTTTTGKLANYLRDKDSKKPLLVAGDVYRPAAIDQLKTIGNQLKLDVFDRGTEANPVDIAQEGLAYAKAHGYDLVFIDTAGRLQIDQALMDELKNIKATVQPDEIILTVDAMTGQEAANVAKAFDEDLSISGVVVTKLDGDSRGGAALSIVSITGKPIKFTGTGEKLADIEIFYPDRMANRILGMGDMLTLIEKAHAEFDEQEAERVAEKMRANTFDFNDFLKQMDQMNKMGPLEDLIKLIPGMNKLPGLDQLKVDPKETARVKAIIQSMTNYERENPDEINQSRRKRIAKGSATSIQEVNRLIKQFNQTREMMSNLTNGNLGGLGNMFGGMGGGMRGGQMPGNKRDQIQAQKLARQMKKARRRGGRKK
ncbi:signal recognition particle [Aerococcus urinaehominis]|uniref:Signal recognition particle protein n=1 Tax=Aerococcus urinaehominis TaxID=128944 RepID=A0A0X8FKG3_9LACT|nr:signal recognition particle protein [Aerococcus urinaehominis]AMB98954.1 signal recognition particle [Aerococcus urinaehominis]SDM41116.1 signal recognition particle subunit FFH/SRP54 (srp54) [Aerococcus urinaehominis]